MTTFSQLPPPVVPLLLTIRFSAALPDLELDIPHPSRTTVVSLKHLIRSHLAEPNSQRRLRFIYAGKIIPDTAVLTSVLRIPPPPTASTVHRGGGNEDDYKKKGAAGKGKSVPGRPVATQRTYINCSIGDSLTTAELEAEAEAAARPAPTSTQQQQQHPSKGSSGDASRGGSGRGGATDGGSGNAGGSPNTGGGATSSTTTPAPRGFDRLLNAGFTPAEVNQLRLQFRSIHSNRYTPDTLPSPDSFRRMEDAWIDDNGAAGGGPGGMGGAGGGSEGSLALGGGGADTDEVGIAATIDVLMRGVVVGFMWPVGSVGWLMREEGMASGRWRWMVGVGVVFSFMIGLIRAMGGDR